MSGRGLPVTVVRACLRGGSGGSPTAVMYEAPLSDDERRRVPERLGTSHAVFVAVGDGPPGGRPVSLRFFTAEGELPACGHGTIAALAFLAARTGCEEYRTELSASGRVFAGWAVREETQVRTAFETGHVDLREPTSSERELVLPALGTPSDAPAPAVRVAAVGRPRMLVPVATRSALAALAPDLDRLRAACDRLGLLGCYVYSAPAHDGRVAARMFAPSIGVPEDIANANSTACLAAHLAGQGIPDIAVDMGDSLGCPATITASARQGASGTRIRLGGTASVDCVVRLR